MNCIIQTMVIDDYDEIYALWTATPGMGISGADTREHIAFFLERNPGLSYVARSDGQICGSVLCGHDGRRGYLHHLAVRSDQRMGGTGRALVEHALAGLRSLGIDRCHIFVYKENHTAQAFWKRVGWYERVELIMMSCNLE